VKELNEQRYYTFGGGFDNGNNPRMMSGIFGHFLEELMRLKTTLLIVALFVFILGKAELCTATDASSEETFSDLAVLIDVPLKTQKNAYLCGLAVVEMLTTYYDQPLSEEQAQYLKGESSKQNGITGLTLEVTLRSADYYTAIFPGTLDHKDTGLYHQLDLHRPLIVMLASDKDKPGHYELVTGYDPKRLLVSVLDPARGALALPVASFMANWKKANFFTLLAVPEKKDDSKNK
jgi:hypothetical protein